MSELEVPIVLLGALSIAIWAFHDFHRSDRMSDIRYSTTLDRYLFGVSAYILFVLICYGLIVVGGYKVTSLTLRWVDLIGSDGKRSEPTLAWTLVGALFFVAVALPNLPGVRSLFTGARAAARALALYPADLQLLCNVIATSKFNPKQESGELLDVWGRYGVTERTAALLSPGTTRVLNEIAYLRAGFALLPVTRAVEKVLQAQADKLVQFDLDYRRLLRRSARALLHAEEIENEEDRRMVCADLSRLVGEEAEEQLARHRTFIAGAALSCFPSPASREEFLARFGYDVSLAPSSRSLVSVLVGVLALTFGWALIPAIWGRLSLTWMSPEFSLVLSSVFNQIFLLAVFQGIAVTVAIFWAIYPKTISTYARPSFIYLPIPAYFRYGLISYMTGAFILSLGALLLGRSYDTSSFRLALSAAPFFLMTVAISYRVDLRLRASASERSPTRVRDGIFVGVTWLVGTVIVQLALLLPWQIYPLLGEFLPSLPRYFVVYIFGSTLLSGVFGFLIGFLVPATAAAKLETRKGHVWDDEQRYNYVLGQLRRSEETPGVGASARS